jgi:outer membrane lipoprotein SlyB
MTTENKSRIHPLMAGAAAAVIIAAMVGVAAMTGNLPGSSAQKAEPAAAAPAKPAAAAAAKPAQPGAAKHTQVASAPTTAQAASHPKAHCADCGVVTDVKLVEIKGEGSGVGAVGGAVVGGVVAHEIFDGKNQGLATIAGAAGGALAGNAIEKNVKTKKRYDVSIKMEDGSSKTIAYAEAPAWKAGDKVKVSGAKVEPRQ